MKKSLILFAVAFVGGVIFLLLPDENQRGKIIMIEALSGIDKVLLNNSNINESFYLVNNNDGWVVQGKIDYRADQEKVEKLVKEFEKRRKAEWVSGSEAYSRFGLSDLDRIGVGYFKGEEKKLEVMIGKRGNRAKSYYLLYGSDPNIYLVSGSREVFDYSENEFRDKTIFQFLKDDVESVSLRNESRTLVLKKVSELVKNQSNQPPVVIWKDNLDSGLEYENGEINDIINTLAGLQAIEFDETEPSTLTDLLATVEIETSSKKKYVIKIIKKNENQQYLVTIPEPEKNVTFVISELDGDRLIKEPIKKSNK